MRCFRFRKRSAIALGLALVAAVDVGLVAGCASTGQVQAKRIGPTNMTLAEVQSELMAFVDTFGSLIVQAAREVEDRSNPEQRLDIHQWKYRVSLSALTAATNANPVVGLIDMTVMVTLTQSSLERHLADHVFQDVDDTLLTAARRGETQIWDLTSRVLEPAYVQQLRELIDQWRAEHPRQWHVSYVRFTDFGAAQQATATSARSRSSIFSLIHLDPLAGLDPAAREIEQSRLLAERMFFFTARAPLLLTWAAEEVVYQTAAMPESQALLATTNRLTDVSERFASSTEQLPEQISEQREKAINQVLEGVTEQRNAILDGIAAERTAFMQGITEQRQDLLAEIDAAQGNLRGTLVEARQTIEAGTELAAVLDSTVQATDALAAEMQANRDPNAEPLDMAEVRSTMADATTTARELRELVTALDQLLVSPEGGQRFGEIQQTIAATEASGARLLNRAFVFLALLVVLIFVASVLRSLIRPRAAER